MTQLSELEFIEDAMKNTKSTRMLIRYQVISLHLKGFYNIQIAEIVGRCNHTVGTYVTAYKKCGIAGLIPTPPPGAQRKLTPEQEQILVETVTSKVPSDVGLEPYISWNSKLICLWVKQALTLPIRMVVCEICCLD
ncbi:MAG: helix-turn-helix domain-containing protein [Cellulosilyticaceae bacterium]